MAPLLGVAYREVLQERTRERVPLDWATTQNNLAGALWTLFVIQHQPHRAATDLRRELVACLLAHGSTFSRVGASGKPGAVQLQMRQAANAGLGIGGDGFDRLTPHVRRTLGYARSERSGGITGVGRAKLTQLGAVERTPPSLRG
jgi:hypothetical protein